MTQLSIFDDPEESDFSSSIRRVERDGETLYSLIDICAIFSDTKRARKYWTDTKKRLQQDGFEVSEKIGQLKLQAADGKFRQTDVADAQTCLRIVQSIPSPKAEPVRQWLARLGVERLEETADPALGIERAQDRAADRYQRMGKDEQWIGSRLRGIDDRKAFTDALAAHVANITGATYAQATNSVYRGLWQRTAAELRQQLGIPSSANLRDYQPRIAAHYQSLVEITVAHMLGKAERVTPRQAIEIIEKIARLLGIQAAQLGDLLGIDPATGQDRLQSGN